MQQQQHIRCVYYFIHSQACFIISYPTCIAVDAQIYKSILSSLALIHHPCSSSHGSSLKYCENNWKWWGDERRDEEQRLQRKKEREREIKRYVENVPKKNGWPKHINRLIYRASDKRRVNPIVGIIYIRSRALFRLFNVWPIHFAPHASYFYMYIHTYVCLCYSIADSI